MTTQPAEERIHVIRVQTPTMTVALVTKPTSQPVEVFEADAMTTYPTGTLKPSKTFSPRVFELLEAAADNRMIDLDHMIDEVEARGAVL